jgi:hypothetical protein
LTERCTASVDRRDNTRVGIAKVCAYGMHPVRLLKNLMPSWLISWLSWSCLGASGTLGLGLVLAAIDQVLHGGAVIFSCALWFFGLGFCLIGMLILRRGRPQLGL